MVGIELIQIRKKVEFPFGILLIQSRNPMVVQGPDGIVGLTGFLILQNQRFTQLTLIVGS